jgi:putative ABC transport system permease protein
MILTSDFGQAFANLRAQKTRTLLTALGIVFGVGSVIGMLAIGAGAREESLRFIEQLGVRNILIDSRPATSQEELQQRRRSSPGLSDRDARILQANIEDLEIQSARRSLHPARVLPKPSRDIPELYGRLTALSTACIWPRANSSTSPTTPPAPPSACSAKPPRSTCSATAPPSANSSRSTIPGSKWSACCMSS